MGWAMMHRFMIIVLCSMALALPAAAQPFRAINWLYVIPISQDSFEVLDNRGSSATEIWCAAADYARAAGLDGVRKRLYIVEPLGASTTTEGAKGVVFTVNPSDAMKNTPSSYSVSVKRPGENLAIGHAFTFCNTMVNKVFGGF